jgi:hypothetical protein
MYAINQKMEMYFINFFSSKVYCHANLFNMTNGILVVNVACN